jgi:nucleoid-associated protein YgaU
MFRVLETRSKHQTALAIKEDFMEDKKNPDPWAIGPETDETETPSGAGNFDATQWHEVKKGETLWKIAEQYYGDGNLYPKIFDANRDILKDPNRINIGQKLRIP